MMCVLIAGLQTAVMTWHDTSYIIRHTRGDDMAAEINRLEGLGAVLKEGPIDNGNGMLIAFIGCPQDVRIELMQLPS